MGSIAYDTQNLKMTYYQLGGEEASTAVATNFGAEPLSELHQPLPIPDEHLPAAAAKPDGLNNDRVPAGDRRGLLLPALASSVDDLEAALVEHLEHLLQFVSALEDDAALADDRPGRLPPSELRALFDAIERASRRVEHREDRVVRELRRCRSRRPPAATMRP